VSPDLGSSNHQPLPPEGEKITKNEVVTESGVHFKQAKHTIRKALQMPKLATKSHIYPKSNLMPKLEIRANPWLSLVPFSPKIWSSGTPHVWSFSVSGNGGRAWILEVIMYSYAHKGIVQCFWPVQCADQIFTHLPGLVDCDSSAC
jgi:hypothetical protein